MVTVGVDTHTDAHVAAALDPAGRLLRPGASLPRPAVMPGCRLRPDDDRGRPPRPGRSSPQRQVRPPRCRVGRPRCPVGTGHRDPKSRDAQVEMIRVLRVARRGAMKRRVQAGAQIDALILTAPEQVRALLRKLTSKQRIRACAALRPGPVSDPASAVKTALRALARRWQALQAEIDDLDSQLAPLVTATAPQLLALPGVGAETAGQLLVTAGDNRDRLRSEASFARLCGAAPIPVSCGRTDRHRLHRGGDRQASSALWRIALVRWAATRPPGSPSPAAPPRGRPRPRSCAAASAASPARSSPTCSRPRLLRPAARTRRLSQGCGHTAATMASRFAPPAAPPRSDAHRGRKTLATGAARPR